MQRFGAALSLLTGTSLILAACSEPGSLVISLALVPAVTSDSVLPISGNVSRVPAEETEIVITASGGSRAAADTAAPDGSFTISVPLAQNAENVITLTAQDGTGSVSAPVSVTIVQDAVPPHVVSSAPFGAEVSTTPAVELTFSEPMVLSSATGVQLSNQGQAVPGSALLSADSLTVTVTLGRVLWENAVYLFSFPGITDLAGNDVSQVQTHCFVTANSAPATARETDPTGDLFALGTPTGASPSDLDLVRLSIHNDQMFGVLRFTAARSFGSAEAADNAFAYIDLDLDQDSTTGFVTLKDTVFAGDPSVASGIRAEYVIALDWFAPFGDSAAVGRYVEPGGFEVVLTLLPDLCGQYFGFAVPMAAFGAEDGNFDYVVLAGNVESDGLLIDPAPGSGHHTAAFAGLFAPLPLSAGSTIERRGVVLRPRRFR